MCIFAYRIKFTKQFTQIFMADLISRIFRGIIQTVGIARIQHTNGEQKNISKGRCLQF